MSGGPLGGPLGPSVSVAQSVGPAPASHAPASTLAAWTPPASQGYVRAPGIEVPGYRPAAPAPVAHVPSLARRITLGGLRLVPLLILYAVVPYLGLQVLQGHGIVSGIAFDQVAVFGVVLAVLSTAAYVARPSRAYGPLVAFSSLGKVLYLGYFAGFAWVALQMSTVGIRLGFGELLLLLAVVPAFGVAAGIATTIEDVRHPGQRLPFDYP